MSIFTTSDEEAKMDIHPKRCSLCLRRTKDFPSWDKHRWACSPCWPDYVRFRRYFKKEHGRFPTVQEFRSE